ncbi:MAG: phenylpyruvate tautomerase MIF-related protein [Cellulosilyticaceae bacterium]
MPYIDSKVSVTLTDAQKETLKAKLGQIITTIPGKSENYLMIGFQDRYDLFFQGKALDAGAFIEVKIFGKASGAVLEQMTGQICELYHQELGINPKHIYVRYEFSEHWGWNGHNF